MRRRDASAAGELRRRQREARIRESADERLENKQPSPQLTIPLQICQTQRPHPRAVEDSDDQRFAAGTAVIFRDIDSHEQLGIVKHVKEETCTIVWLYRKTLLQRVSHEGGLNNSHQFTKYVDGLGENQCLQSIYTDEVPHEDILEQACIEFPQFCAPAT